MFYVPSLSGHKNFGLSLVLLRGKSESGKDSLESTKAMRIVYCKSCSGFTMQQRKDIINDAIYKTSA
jgi:hypothetical protein